MRLLVLSLTLWSMAGFAEDEHLRALELYKKGQFKDAVVVLEEAIATHPDWWFPIMLKGQCNLKLKNYNEALANLNDALTLEIPTKEIPKAKKLIADTFMAMKDYPKAVNAYSELLPLVPASRHFDIYFRRGQCETQYARSQESRDRAKAKSYFSKGVVSFSEALKLGTSRKSLEVEAAFQKAYCQYKIGNFQGGIRSLDQSIAAFKDVIERNPKEKRAHTFIVNLAFEITDKASESRKPAKFEEAVGYLDRYLSYWPDDIDMLYKKGLALQGAKKYEDAVLVLKQVVQARPRDGEAMFSLGSCQMAAGKHQAAIGTFEKAINNGQKDNPSVYAYLANCYQQQKNGCHFHDIPIYEKASEALARGVRSVKGPAREALNKDLARKRDNLKILMENRNTDNRNHKAVIDNIRKLEKSLATNRETLVRNQELNLQQSTAELLKAIEDGKVAIKDDEATLSKEYRTLQGYIGEAKKCGGSQAFPNYAEMTALLKRRS